MMLSNDKGNQMNPIATLCLTTAFGIDILGVDYSGPSNVIQWKWSNEKAIHTSTIKMVHGKESFRANRMWIALDECMRG